MNRYLLAANWKMNLRLDEAKTFLKAFVAEYQLEGNGKRVLIAVPFPYILPALELTAGYSGIKIAAQNLHHEAAGAYTGEVSAEMLASCGVDAVLVGHSERRQYFREENAVLAKKAELALDAGLDVVYCLGETQAERGAGQTLAVVEQQLKTGIGHLDALAWQRVVIAYEPVWAIGTGLTAEPADAQAVHAHIRALVEQLHGADHAQATSILYGGSVKPSNAKALFAESDIDGGLVGGASLHLADFTALLKALPSA